MPDLLETITLDLNLAADLVDPPQDRDHSVEHVSDLINKLAGIVGRRTYEGEPTEEAWRMMAMGRISEAVLRPIITHQAEKEGLTFIPQQVMVCDDVVGSLDGLLVSPAGREAVVEIKSRYASPGDPTNNANDTHWRYMLQTMSYAYMARVSKAWLVGLYFPRGAPGVELKLHRIEFSVPELIENCQLLRNLRRNNGNARGP